MATGTDHAADYLEHVIRELDKTDRQMLENLRHAQPPHDAAYECLLEKAEKHAHMMAIYFMHYNFVRIHKNP
jgi:hypothetical protein